MPKTCGVYMITNEITADFYIGSSVEIERRWKNHKYCCQKYEEGRKWTISHLYRAMQKYGVEAFKIETLEICSPDHLREREQHYMDTLQPKYNCSSRATGGGGEWSRERKKQYSEIRKAEVAQGIRVPPPSWTTGNKDFRHSEESKQKMKDSMAKAVERAKEERGSYVTPEGLASRMAKMEERLTPERRQQFAESTKEALEAAHIAWEAATQEFSDRFLPMIEGLQETGLNFMEIAEQLNEKGYTARRGGPWNDQNVSDLLKRAGKAPDRPRGQPAEQVRKKNSDEFAHRMFPIIDQLRQSGMNMSEIAIRLNEDGYESRRGAQWTYSNVREVLKRVRQIEAQISKDDELPVPLPNEYQPRFIGWHRV